MTRVESAALALLRFIRENTPPPEVIGSSRAHEWPLSITADNEDDAIALTCLLAALDEEMQAAGFVTKRGPKI